MLGDTSGQYVFPVFPTIYLCRSISMLAREGEGLSDTIV